MKKQDKRAFALITIISLAALVLIKAGQAAQIIPVQP